MKHADDMLKQILDEVDTNKDGKIQYDGMPSPSSKKPILHRSASGILRDQARKLTPHLEFRKFVEKAERQLLILFQAIDKNRDGKLDKNELLTAFKGAGLTVSKRRLADFFDDMDINHDGYINFDEWRFVKLFLWLCQFFFSHLDHDVGETGQSDGCYG